MPGTFKIDTAGTFATAILMASAAKAEFGQPGQQAVSASGERKWQTDLAVTFHANQPGMRPVSEVISVTITGPPTDPAAGIPVGALVELDDFRVGWTAPESRENGRVRGGRPWYSAAGIRQAHQRGSKGEAA
jgi:hypothetical protein